MGSYRDSKTGLEGSCRELQGFQKRIKKRAVGNYRDSKKGLKGSSRELQGFQKRTKRDQQGATGIPKKD